MINQTIPTGLSTPKQAPFGLRLKSARESLGLDKKEIALQLRLNENMITMIEHGEYTSDIPMMFIRGYIRGYSKLLGIPDKELHEAMELMNPKQELNEEAIYALASSEAAQTNNTFSLSNYFPAVDMANLFMKLFTCLLVVTLIGLVGIWWHSHKATPHRMALSATSVNIPAPVAKPLVKPVVKTPTLVELQGKAALTNMMTVNRGMQMTVSFILFLIVITLSMRIYATPVMTGQASLRRNNVRRQQPVSISHYLNALSSLNLNYLIPTAIVLSVLSATWWYKHTHAHLSTNIAKKPAQTKPMIDTASFNTDFAILPSPQTLNAFYLGSIKPYALQYLSNQLDQYIADADATLFALTDKSTPIGQFHYKKYRRHRTHYRHNYNTNNDTVPPYYSN